MHVTRVVAGAVPVEDDRNLDDLPGQDLARICVAKAGLFITTSNAHRGPIALARRNR